MASLLIGFRLKISSLLKKEVDMTQGFQTGYPKPYKRGHWLEILTFVLGLILGGYIGVMAGFLKAISCLD